MNHIQNTTKGTPQAASLLQKNKLPPKVAAIHDVSCIGRCAITVILPVLSACGNQVCPLPTALLSTHTGGYTGFTFLDLTSEMPKITDHWETLGTAFDAVYSGFLGSADQIEIVRSFAQKAKERNPSCLFLADPVMGDDGTTYATYTPEMCRRTRQLIADADIITPNLTEACILLDMPYDKQKTEADLCTMAKKLSQLCKGLVFITGIHRDINDTVGVVYYDKKTDRFGTYFTPRDPQNYPGTGDVFASVILAGALAGLSPEVTAVKACDFICEASHVTTMLGTPVREGLVIEPLLGRLIS